MHRNKYKIGRVLRHWKMWMGIPKVKDFPGFLLLQGSPFCFSFTAFIEKEVRLREDNKGGHLNAQKNEQRRMVEENKQKNGGNKASNMGKC